MIKIILCSNMKMRHQVDFQQKKMIDAVSFVEQTRNPCELHLNHLYISATSYSGCASKNCLTVIIGMSLKFSNTSKSASPLTK